MKVYFISYKLDAMSPIINDRIESLGDYYRVAPTQYFVCCQNEVAQNVYETIAKDDFTNLSILVISVNPAISTDYWGVGKTEMWDWFKSHSINDEH